ncbi:Phenylpropionate dioxygenase, large terminal subunit [Enhydrobacter aerosaccus]|uniref:Phenylpropionate dioxygenase, large terminal subunit n=1 Tax=Enhydrobacter aerosaccus TaxID=225324 RepID=A0A1T4SID7_9HYPH|nr:Rieske 2Fe-2S domain-containing protein [Enhydrobacter aerosaccus]SKA27601.1 Phenylpropionate dioxygenase, large terminal subunit [Enhydrobacter aerosaccus]
MLTQANNDMLCRVGPGTPMGNLMRQYWVPACLSSELKPDGEPMRLLLLGEQLIAFRDTQGRVGIMEHRCPHRCASLFFGRNEEGGLRCVYHGWKFDVEGNCTDMPNVPPSQDFKERIKAKAYRVVERAGFVWTYMGSREEAPPLPNIEVLMLPEEESNIRVHQRECNWFQSLEGDIDTSHFGFLHIGSLDVKDVDPKSIHRWGVMDRAPSYKATETEWGTMYAAYREADPDTFYYRFAHFLLPFYTFTPNGSFEDQVACTINVPMDDTHTMTYNVNWKKKTLPLQTLANGDWIPGLQPDMQYLPDTTDWYGRHRLVARRDNDYFIDRQKQKTESYTGIQGIGRQDQAAVECMGEIVDRTLEHLAPSDRMIAITRKRALSAAQELMNENKVPATVDDPDIYRRARGGSFIASANLDWLAAYAQKLETAKSPLGLLMRMPEAAE